LYIYVNDATFQQVQRGIRPGGQAEERHARIDRHAQVVAERAQEEPVPDQGREDHVGHHHQDDVDAGEHVVREREKAAEEREQDDMGTQEQDGRRRRRRRVVRLRGQGQGRHAHGRRETAERRQERYVERASGLRNRVVWSSGARPR